MTEAIYKVGDILEIPGNVALPRQFGMFPKEETCRCLVLNVLHSGFDSISYTFLTHKDGFGTFNIVGVDHANIADCAKLIDHCDISALKYERSEEVENAMLKSQIACMEGRIESLVQERDQLDADNRYLSAKVKHLTFSNDRKNGKIGSLQANLAEETLKRDQAEVELNEKAEQIYQLKKENESFRIGNNKLSESLSNSEMKAHSRLNEISFLARKVNELESENNDLKTELVEKTEELKKVYSSDLACENNRLVEVNKKLSAENTRYLQSMTCAEKQMTEAAKRIYEAREHLNVAYCND